MIFETLFYKRLFSKNWNNPNELITYLEDKGFVKIGQGWYSVVYSLPNSSFVIKINSGDFDYGFCYFINMCIENKINPHLIDIFAYKEYTLYNPFYFVLLPKLKELSTFEENANITILRTMCNLYQNKIESYDSIISKFPYIDEEFKDLFDLLISIDTTIYKFDICQSNILQDHKNRWVLSDPIHKIKK